MGADVAIVAGETGGETRGSLRANQRFWEATKIHLGTDVAAAIAKEAAYGGGHPTAASFTCSIPEEGGRRAPSPWSPRSSRRSRRDTLG